MLDYIKRFNSSVQGTLKDPLTHVSYNPFGYSRDSSHLNQASYRHYGIDIRFGASGPELPLLPAEKRHILFAKVDEAQQLIFIKPENYGLYYTDGLIAHGFELGESKLRKFGVTKKSDDDPTYHKERIPKQFLADFTRALIDAGIPEKQRSELLALANKLEIGMKIIFTDDLLKLPAMQALEKKYKQEYDHLEMRIGREIILTPEELKPRP